LSDYLQRKGKLSDKEVKFFAANIINGMEHIHGRGIIHRDLKPSNILLGDDFNPKIADFGTAKIFDCHDSAVNRALDKRQQRDMSRSNSPWKKHSFVGTNEYISPEVLKGNAPSYATDLWSFGVIMYKMYTGVTPFVGYNEVETYENICNGRLKQHKDLPKAAYNFIKTLLKVDPRERVGSDEKLVKINYKVIKSDLYFSTLDFDDLKFPQEERNTEIFEESLDVTRGEISLHGRESTESIPVPCIMDEDDDFYENWFIPQPQGEEKSNIKDKESLKKKTSSDKNLFLFLKEDHFHEKLRKQSLKWDTNSYWVPILFDEESDVVFSSTVGSRSPLIL
jgi:serine/threonine protein kinase